jgi:NAD(P)-dependent dehydrogenase (short-subunit alcohol dehydrogenase family)
MVTGAAAGIGRAVVEDLVGHGCHVLAFDVSAAGLAALSDDLGRDVTTACLDVSNGADVARQVAAATTSKASPDYLVCAAGINPITRGTEAVGEDFYESVTAVNLKGTFTFCRAVLPMIGRGGTGIPREPVVRFRAGRVGGIKRLFGHKGGVIALTRALAVEYARAGVRVTASVPGRCGLLWSLTICASATIWTVACGGSPPNTRSDASGNRRRSLGS